MVDHVRATVLSARSAVPRVSPRAAGCIAILVSACVVLADDKPADVPENLALRATITASSTFSDQYAGKLVADGVVPEAMRYVGEGRAKGKVVIVLE